MIKGIDGWVICAWAMENLNAWLILIKAGDHIPLPHKRQSQRLLKLEQTVSVSPAFPVTLAGSLCRVVVLPPTRGDEPRRPGPMSSWNISYPLNALRRSSCSLERRFINPLRVYDSLRARDSPLPLFLSLGRVGSSMTAYFCLSHYW